MHLNPWKYLLKYQCKNDNCNGQDKKLSNSLYLVTYFKKTMSAYLRYEEAMEEGSVRTIVKMAAEEALILRNGAVKMRLPFEK